MSSNYIRCDIDDNIFYKEQYYSELTFHYWYWKNLLTSENQNEWIGFCQRRRYFVKDKINQRVDLNNINGLLLENLKRNGVNMNL